MTFHLAAILSLLVATVGMSDNTRALAEETIREQTQRVFTPMLPGDPERESADSTLPNSHRLWLS